MTNQGGMLCHNIVKENSILVKVDFSKQDDIDKFFGDDEFPEYVEIVSNV